MAFPYSIDFRPTLYDTSRLTHFTHAFTLQGKAKKVGEE
jgi:hypothetical protein